jgi:hypothetical protein
MYLIFILFETELIMPSDHYVFNQNKRAMDYLTIKTPNDEEQLIIFILFNEKPV